MPGDADDPGRFRLQHGQEADRPERQQAEGLRRLLRHRGGGSRQTPTRRHPGLGHLPPEGGPFFGVALQNHLRKILVNGFGSSARKKIKHFRLTRKNLTL
jgi:hypothetical protein